MPREARRPVPQHARVSTVIPILRTGAGCFLAVLTGLAGCVHASVDPQIHSQSVSASHEAQPANVPLPTERDMEAARSAVRDRPRSGEAHLQLAKAYIGMGQIQEGAAELRTAVRMDPKLEPAWRALARLY